MTYPTARHTHPSHRRRCIAGGLTLALAALAVGPAAPLAAQGTAATPAIATVGSLVRITQPSVTSGRSQRLVGRLLPSNADYLRIVRQNGDTANLPRQGVTKLEVSTGQPRSVMSSVVVGAFGIGAATAALSALTYQPASCPPEQLLCFDIMDRGDTALMGGVLGAALGAVGGLIVGVTRDPHVWRQVSLSSVPARVLDRVTLAPLLGRTHGLRMGISF